MLDGVSAVTTIIGILVNCFTIIEAVQQNLNPSASFIKQHVEFSLFCARFRHLYPILKARLEDPRTDKIDRNCIAFSIYYIASELEALQKKSKKYEPKKLKPAPQPSQKLLKAPPSSTPESSTAVVTILPVSESLLSFATFSTHGLPGFSEISQEGQGVRDELLSGIHFGVRFWRRVTWALIDHRKFDNMVKSLRSILTSLESLMSLGNEVAILERTAAKTKIATKDTSSSPSLNDWMKAKNASTMRTHELIAHLRADGSSVRVKKRILVEFVGKKIKAITSSIETRMIDMALNPIRMQLETTMEARMLVKRG